MAKFKIVCGFPGSGKTTYIKEHIKKGDLVFDYDEIQSAITFQPKHLDSKGIHPYLIEILKNMKKRAKNDKNIDVFWIIRTVPDSNFRQMFSDCETEYLFINKTTFECLEQIKKDRERDASDKNWYTLLMDLQGEFMKGAFEGCRTIND